MMLKTIVCYAIYLTAVVAVIAAAGYYYLKATGQSA